MPIVLHLFSNHKVTGPAELALDTSRSLDGRPLDSQVIESRFLPGRHPRDPFWLGELAERRQARLVQVPGLRLRKHFNPVRTYLDARALARYLETEGVGIVHCHLPNDHLIASLARQRLERRGRRVPIVRTVYDGDPPRVDWRLRRTLGGATDHAICFSSRVRDGLLAGLPGLDPASVSVLEAPIDTARFAPERAGQLPDGRRALGLPASAFVAGIVARMQTHRRFEVLLEAVRLARSRIPGFRFVIIGRGTHQVRVAREPVRRLGLQDTVVFSGFLSGDDYVAALLALDLKLFLVPGSDGTCRAVREAMAAGVPVLAARRGLLPEIVEDGVTGRVVEDSAENLAAAMVELARDSETLSRLGAAARRKAVERFQYDRYVKSLEGIYARVLGRN